MYEQIDKETFNWQRLFFRIVKYWYLVLGCFLISVLFAFVKNKQAQRIYQADMSLLLKDDQLDENSAAILYQNGLMTANNSLAKDEYLIKSYPFVYSALMKLGFDVSFYSEKREANAEVYPKVPLRIQFEGDRCIPSETPFYFIIISEINVLVFVENQRESAVKTDFGKPFVFNHCQMTIFKLGQSVEPYFNKQYAVVYHDMASLTTSYQNSLNAKAVSEDVNVLLLSVRDGNVNKAIDFLSEITNTYIGNNIRQKNERANRGIQFIIKQLHIASDSLIQIEAEMQNIKRVTKINAISSEGERLFSRLEILDARKSEVRLTHIYMDTLFEYLRPNKNVNGLIMPSVMGLIDPVLNDRVIALVNLQVEKKKLDSLHIRNVFYGKLNTQIGEEKLRVREVLKNIMTKKKIEENEIDEQLQSINKSIDQLPSEEGLFISIQRKYASMESLYTLLNNKLAEVNITKASSLPDFEIVNPPSSNGQPIAPDFKKNYITAFLLGLAFPIGIIFLTMLLSTTVESLTDIKNVTSIPVIGVIGNDIDKEILSQNRKSIVAESFRTIRSKLRFMGANDSCKVYMVTSCFCGEGKTFCSTNLAIVHATAGKKTLLVSADMRKHHTYHGLIVNESIGLAEHLSSPIPLDDVIQTTKIDNLDIIGTGKLPLNPSELLSSIKVNVFINDLRNKYDIVILDTPPLGIISDALNLLQFADSNILIVRQNFTHKNLLQAVSEMCQSNGLDKISIIFNDVKFSKLESRYGYYYGNIYGYEYGGGRDNEKRKNA